MQYIADFHLHSRFSRAVSKDMILPVMAELAEQKGLDILTAADFTHPVWFKEIASQLEEANDGLYRLKKGTKETKETHETKDTLFLLSTEIASIYKDRDKLRRIHNLVFAPNLETAGKINKELLRRGANLSSDGRPIIGLSSRSLLELILEVDERCFLIPCHVWTPHFGLYGSASGYDSIEESFGDLSQYVYGIETGLSSDPEMNWLVPELRNRSILSFSDAHSPAKMGREATVFVNGTKEIQGTEEAIMYEDIRQAIMRKGKEWKVGYTIEFYPEEGKYHYSGHRNCNIVETPEQIEKQGNRCPVCQRKLTEGVLFRVQQVSGKVPGTLVEEKINEYGLKWYTDKTHHHPPYVKLVPLLEICAESLHMTVSSQKVKTLYQTLITDLAPEMQILLRTPIVDIEKIGGERVAEGVQKVREGKIVIDPGYDGVYGRVAIWPENEQPQEEQLGLL